MYNIAIAGAGAIAGFHARAVGDLPNATLVGACARTPGKAAEFCNRHGGRGYDALEHMLDEARPDVLLITTPSGAHLEPALAAAARGIHVLCEKPLEITLDRADAMIAACADANVRLGGIFQMRMSPLYQMIREVCAAGRLGSRPTINGSVPWWRNDDYYGPSRWQGTQALDGGGAIINQSIHVVDMMQWLAQAAFQTPDPVAEVFCYCDQLGHHASRIEVEDAAVMCLRYRGSQSGQVGLGQLHATTACFPGSSRRLFLGGRGGTIETAEDRLATWTFSDPEPADESVHERFGGADAGTGAAADPLAMSHAAHRANIAHFLGALDAQHALELDGAESRKALAITLAAYESAATGLPVKLSQAGFE